MIPKLSHPLTKSLRTAEFWAVAIADVALTIIPIVQGGLSPHLAAELGTGLTAAYAVSRSIIKGVALVGPATGTSLTSGDQAQAQKLATDVGAVAEALDPQQWLASRETAPPTGALVSPSAPAPTPVSSATPPAAGSTPSASPPAQPS